MHSTCCLDTNDPLLRNCANDDDSLDALFFESTCCYDTNPHNVPSVINVFWWPFSKKKSSVPVLVFGTEEYI